MSGFNFNAESFIIGLGAGWGTALLAYRRRGQIKDLSNALRGRPSEGRDVSIRGADSRYLSDLAAYAQADHLAGDRVNFSEIMVEPRFLPAPKPAEPPDEDFVQSVFHVVPTIPDLPYLHAYYNLPTIALQELDNGDNAIAILGEPGSGRTSALHAIALWVLGQVDFRPPPDPVQLQLEAEEADLNSEQRALRLQNRLMVEEMAKQSLARKRGEDPDEAEEKAAPRTLLKQLTPIYVHCANVIANSREYGRMVDPAEPLIRASQQYVRGLTRRTMSRGLYRRIERGQALLLIDGLDELPQAEQAAKLEWLRALRQTYPQTFTIVTGPINGYGPLLNAGFASVYLRPWNDITAHRMIDRWAQAWPSISTARRPEAPQEEIIEIAKEDTRARTPFEMTLKTWAILEDPEQTGYEDWIRRAIGRYLNESLEDVLPKLQELAALQLEEGFITVQRLEEIALRAAGALLPDEPAAATSDEVSESADDFLASLETVEADEDQGSIFYTDDDDEIEEPDLEAVFSGRSEAENVYEREPEAEKPVTYPESMAAPVVAAEEVEVDEEEAEVKPDSNIGREYAQLIRRLRAAGLLKRYRGNRYQFRHPLIVDYIGSLALVEMEPEAQEAKLHDPAWKRALMYSVLHTDIDEIAEMRFNTPSDVLHNNLLEMARWLAYLPERTEWRNELLRRLGNLFVAPTQYQLVRERVAAALVGTRDRGVMRIFQTALTHPKPIVRQLAVLGTGALHAEESVAAVSKMLEDADDNVKLAAGLALGAIGSEAALEEMVTAFTQPNERLQQALAEAFAAIPSEGYPVLYDAIRHEDMSLRRAAVFGLRRINTPWALITLYQTSMEDDQWYVRNAAEMAFSGMEIGDTAGGPTVYPRPDEIPWLRDWIVSLGDVVQQTTPPEEFLGKAIQEGREDLQELAALNIGRLGYVRDVGLLYQALRHRNSRIREASHRALSEMQSQIGQPLPAPAV